jgi:methyl-accepting chemotaxis protein
VANEAKALAGETAQATEEIEARITSIQSETKSAIGQIEEIDELIELISGAQTKIVDGLMHEIERSGSLNQRVADATDNTAAIREKIVELTKVSKHTISHSADSHQSAIMLASSAQKLTMLIQAFENCRADRPFEITEVVANEVKSGEIELF